MSVIIMRLLIQLGYISRIILARNLTFVPQLLPTRIASINNWISENRWADLARRITVKNLLILLFLRALHLGKHCLAQDLEIYALQQLGSPQLQEWISSDRFTKAMDYVWCGCCRLLCISF